MWHKVNIAESQGSPTNPSLTGDKLSGCTFLLCTPNLRALVAATLSSLVVAAGVYPGALVAQLCRQSRPRSKQTP
jgi:hypothetical protein